MTTLEEYLKNKIQKKTLPSGLEITVKKISPYTSMQIKSELEKSEDTYDALSTVTIDKLFRAYVKSPIIPDEMKMEDFDSEDFNTIYNWILDQIMFKRAKEIKEVINSDKDFFLPDKKSE